MINKNVYDILEKDYHWKRVQATIHGKEVHNNFRNTDGDTLSLYEDVNKDVFVEANGRRYKLPTADVLAGTPISDDENAPKLSADVLTARFIDLMADRIINGDGHREQSAFDTCKGKRAKF